MIIILYSYNIVEIPIAIMLVSFLLITPIVLAAMADENVISPSELAVLDSLMSGGSALSLKVSLLLFEAEM